MPLDTHRLALERALTATCRGIAEELASVPLIHWKEDVFRFFLVRCCVPHFVRHFRLALRTTCCRLTPVLLG